MKHHVAVSLLAAAVLAAGCRRIDDVAYSEFHSIGPVGWNPDRVLGFSPWPVDSVSPPGATYSLGLCVRFSTRFRPTPLHVVVIQENGDIQQSDTITMPLDMPESRPGGRGAFGVQEVCRTVSPRITLREGYVVELRSLTATENTRGITEVGVMLSENGSPRRSFFRIDKPIL